MRSRYRAFAIVLLGFAWGCTVCVGCKSKSPSQLQGQWVHCKCPYLTDFDQVANHHLQVCVPNGSDAPQQAFKCAGKLVHGPAEPCTCKQPAARCDLSQPCQSEEYK